MTELERIATVWREAAERGEWGVLATVVQVQGSSYRRPGARLLLTSGGRRVGSVSGGCLEADLVKKARWLTAGEQPALRIYDTSVEAEAAEEFGLGCNGIIHVFLERLGSPASEPLLELPAAVKRCRRPATVATVIAAGSGGSPSFGERAIYSPGGPVQSSISHPQLQAALNERANSLDEWRSDLLVWQGAGAPVHVFLERVTPALRLLVFGAGDDAVPVVRLAKFLGYEVWVLDGRSHLARADRFPEADRIVVIDPAEPLSGIAIDSWTAAVLMTHSYRQDLTALQSLAAHPLPYLGILGPRRRTSNLLGDAGLDAAHFGLSLHSPIGLDIGADGAEQIALALVSEIQAVVNGRSGGQLHDRAGPLETTPQGAADERYRVSAACPLG